MPESLIAEEPASGARLLEWTNASRSEIEWVLVEADAATGHFLRDNRYPIGYDHSTGSMRTVIFRWEECQDAETVDAVRRRSGFSELMNPSQGIEYLGNFWSRGWIACRWMCFYQSLHNSIL